MNDAVSVVFGAPLNCIHRDWVFTELLAESKSPHFVLREIDFYQEADYLPCNDQNGVSVEVHALTFDCWRFGLKAINKNI